MAEVIGSLGLCYLAKIRVERGDRIAHVPTGSGELKAGLLHAILRQLGFEDPRPVIGGGVKQIPGPAAWPIDLIPAEEGGFIVNFPDLPNG